MSKQRLVFNDIEVNKNDFYVSKQEIPLNSVNTNNIVIRPLRVLLPQMSGYIKRFENGVKNLSFKTEDEDVYLKCNEIWNEIQSTLNVKFHIQPIYDDKYMKTKVKTFSNTINTLLS